MNRRTGTQVLAAVLLLVAGIAIALVAYNVGYSTGVADAGQAAGRVVPGPFYYGGFGRFGLGFGFLSLLFPLFFFFLIFAFVRAIFWGGPRRYGPYGYDRWHEGPRGDFDSWHRQAHGAPTGQPGGSQPASGPMTGAQSSGQSGTGPGDRPAPPGPSSTTTF